jgi:adenine-specific DNA methylase
MFKYGRYDLIEKPYQRFKTENRNHSATETMEYLLVLVKE